MDADTLLKRARLEGTPLVDGETVTFVWRGKFPPQLLGDWTGWESGTPVSLDAAGPGVWIHSTDFPSDAYLEYAYLRGEKRLRDSLNPRIVDNGVGSYNHFFSMPRADSTRLTVRPRGVARGTVTRHVIDGSFASVGSRRAVYWYQPPYDGPVPLLVVFDGGDFIRRARLAVIVDNLIAQGRMEPVAMALVEHSRRARFVEYASGDAALMFILNDVLPLSRRNLNLVDIEAAPGAYGVMGASMGGLMALYAGLRLPHVFGSVVSLSGAFSLPGLDPVVNDMVREFSTRPLKIWLSVGRYEWLLDANRRMHALLEQKGYAVAYREFNAGHNYTAWREDLWRGLEELFPGENTGERA
ncbi:MAG: alpha/beta hydrolase [Rudaea sp.]